MKINLKKLFLMICLMSVLCVFSVVSAEQAEQSPVEERDVLVVYFSATGTTKGVAEKIAALTDADIFEIVPAEPYTSADLNWNDRNSRTSVETDDPSCRPEIDGEPVDLEGYSTIFIGYPIWWYTHPRIIETFFDKAELKGKTVHLFATSGGSGITDSMRELKTAYPDVNIVDGKRI